MEEGGGGEGGEEEEEDEEDSDSEGEDGVNVIIDQKRIEEDKTKTIQSMQIKQSQREGGVNKSKKQGTFAVEDFDAIASITVNGQSTAAVELDMESLEDKPWRKPGADITDYFNYGFSEDTWNAYCQRQHRIRRSETGAVGMHTGGAMKQILQQPGSAAPIVGASQAIPTVGLPKRLPTVLNRTSVPPPTSTATPNTSIPPPTSGPPPPPRPTRRSPRQLR